MLLEEIAFLDEAQQQLEKFKFLSISEEHLQNLWVVELGLWVVELDRNFQQSIWASLGKISINLVRILSNYSNILPVNNPLPPKNPV